MKISYQLDKWSLHAEVKSDDGEFGVTVCRNHKYGCPGFAEPEINWSALGSVDIRTAEIYAELLLHAINIAKDFQKEPRFYRIRMGVQDRKEEYTEEVLAVNKYDIMEGIPPGVTLISCDLVEKESAY